MTTAWWDDPIHPLWSDPCVSIPARAQAARAGLDLAEYDRGRADGEAQDLAADPAAWEATRRRGAAYWRGFYESLVALESYYGSPHGRDEYKRLTRDEGEAATERWVAQRLARIREHRHVYLAWMDKR